MYLTLVLRVEGDRVTGAVNTCSTVPFVPAEIRDGRISGNTVTFSCTSEDGDRTIAFRGVATGDAIDFAWDLTTREGGGPPELFDPFAPLPGRRVQPPPRFSATRAPEAQGEAILTRLARLPGRPEPQTVTAARLLSPNEEPHNWLTYSGNLSGHRHTQLTEIDRTNVGDLGLAWTWQQSRAAGRFQATPLVVDGVLYTVQAPNDVVALDAATGRFLWMYRHSPAPAARASGGGGRVNRGVAVYGDTLFLGTLDAHLLALSAKTGDLVWDVAVADSSAPECQVPDGWSYCYNIAHAPLIVGDKVVVGTGGGDGSIRGLIVAFDAQTGAEVWRFRTVPAPGEPGGDTWSGDSWKVGGAGVWTTGTYDADLGLTYWGTGNPFPVSDGSTRLGANLYSNSIVALDAESGRLEWHYQLNPHDEDDLDAAHVPVLADLDWEGVPRKLLVFASKNGSWYVFDRRTGELLRQAPLADPVEGIGGTNWYPPSFSVQTGLFYVPVRANRVGSVRAFDPQTGRREWDFARDDAVFASGVLTTASDLVFAGTWGGQIVARPADGFFFALDARSGEELWKLSLGGPVFGGPISYSVDGRQYIAVAAGDTLFALTVRR